MDPWERAGEWIMTGCTWISAIGAACALYVLMR